MFRHNIEDIIIVIEVLYRETHAMFSWNI